MSDTTSAAPAARFDAILFDAGGVFILPDETVFAAVLAPLGATQDLDRYRRAHYSAMKAKSDVGSLESTWNAYDRGYATSVGVAEADLAHAIELLADVRSPHLWRSPITESVETARELHARGVPMGVVSNAAGQVEAALARLGICQVGDGAGVPMRVVIDSHIVGVTKPDPAIFEFALPYFDGIDRSRVLYVGDSVTMDLGGAAAAGLPAVLIDPYDDHANADFERIRSLSDLLDMV